MNRVELLKTYGQSCSVQFVEFTRIHSKAEKLLICIFEGQDEKYYSLRLDSAIGSEKWRGVVAYGRKNVIELELLLRNHPIYSTGRFCCFIDHDFHDNFLNPNPDRIYITPCYSIENLYVSRQSFVKILSAEFGITEFNEFSNDYFNVLKIFDERMIEFNSAIYTFNCWVKAHRIMEEQDATVRKLNIKNVKFNSLVEIFIDKVVIKYDLTNPSSIFKDFKNLDICENAIYRAAKSFDERKYSMQFRGKQQIEFFKTFLMKLKEDRTSRNPIFFGYRGNVFLTLSANCISEISQYADTPDCLTTFLSLTRNRLAA